MQQLAFDPKLPPNDPDPKDPFPPLPQPDPDDPGPDVVPSGDPDPLFLRAGWHAKLKYPVALIVLAAFSYGQSKASPDPHEDPAVQNSPVGKKDSAKPAATPKAAPKKTPAVVKAPAKKPKQVAVAPPLDEETAMIGTWNLVTTRSSYQPGPMPQSETRTYTKTPSGIVAKVVTVRSDGATETLDFPWMVDGSEQSVKGSELLDTIQLRKVDNLTAEATLRHGTKELVKERRELAADGKTMTITVTDMTSEDRPVRVTAVYEKQ